MGRKVSYPELMEYAALPEFTEVAGWTSSMVVTEIAQQESQNIQVQFATPNFFRVLGLRPAVGTFFKQTRGDEHREPELSAVLGYAYAVEAFGIPENAIGKSVRLNGVNATVVGVAPPRFGGALGADTRRVLWMPVSAWPTVDRMKNDAFTSRRNDAFQSVARLRDEASIERALPGIRLVASRSEQAVRDAGRTGMWRSGMMSADAVRLRGQVDVSSGTSDAFQLAGIVAVLVTLVLLLCATTVSSLLVGAALTRRHEIAVRLALGASRLRIVRQLITETTLLAFVAGIAGLFLFAGVARVLRVQLHDVDIDPSWTTAVATALFALVTSVLCGLSPALHATHDGLSSVLKDSSTNATVKSRLQRTFVVAQMALTQPLLVLLVMAIAIVFREGDHDRRTVRDNIVSAQFDTWSAASRAENRIPALAARYAALPGVLQVVPQVNGYMILGLEAPAVGERPARRFDIRTLEAPPGYFKAMDIKLARGREFVENDATARANPVIIGSDLALLAFGNADPIGKRFHTFSAETGHPSGDGAVVVGVVNASQIGSSEFGSRMRVFTPLSGNISTRLPVGALLIRTATPAEPMIRRFREIARSEMPMTPVYSMKTLAQEDREQRGEVLEATTASALGGMITLFLAAIGLYAVVALAVTQRRKEIGVRISLGATPGQVVGFFFRSGLRTSLLGLVIGLPLSIVAIQLVAPQLGIPKANMPVVAGAVALMVVIVASLASWIPARRAAGVDPLMALRDG
jgi:predicted permease